MYKKIVLCLLCFSLLFCGCQKNVSLSQMSISQGVSIDKKDDEIMLGIQYLDLSKGASTTDNLDENITSVVFDSGKNISQIVSKISARLSSPIFFGQNKIIVFGSDYCKSNFTESLDYILRGVDSRPDIFVAMSETDAKSIIKSPQSKAKVPAIDVYDTVKSSEDSGLSICVTVNDVLNASKSKTSDIFMPVLSADEKLVSCDGIAVFSNDSLALVLNDIQTLGFCTMKQKAEGANFTIIDKRLGNVGIEISRCKVKNKAILSNDELKLSSKISIKLILNETQKGVAVKVNEKDISRLEALAKNKIQKACSDAVMSCFLSGCDPFDFGKMVAKSYPSYYRDVCDDWHSVLSSVVFSPEVDARLELVSNSLLKN